MGLDLDGLMGWVGWGWIWIRFWIGLEWVWFGLIWIGVGLGL